MGTDADEQEEFVKISGTLRTGDKSGDLHLVMNYRGRPLKAERLATAEASMIADLTTAVSDLEYAQRLSLIQLGPEVRVTEMILSEHPSGPSESSPADDVHAALLEAAVMAYSRSFSSGRSALVKGPRRRLQEFVDGLSSADRAAHDEVMHMRDQHVAHRVDRTLTQTIVAKMTTAEGEYFGVMPLLVTQTGRQLTMEQVGRLTDQLLPVVRSVLQQELIALNRAVRPDPAGQA